MQITRLPFDARQIKGREKSLLMFGEKTAKINNIGFDSKLFMRSEKGDAMKFKVVIT